MVVSHAEEGAAVGVVPVLPISGCQRDFGHARSVKSTPAVTFEFQNISLLPIRTGQVDIYVACIGMLHVETDVQNVIDGAHR